MALSEHVFVGDVYGGDTDVYGRTAGVVFSRVSCFIPDKGEIYSDSGLLVRFTANSFAEFLVALERYLDRQK